MAELSVIPLIQGCLSGDRQAQEALIAATQNRIYYHCKKMLRRDEDAMDCTQEVLITMLTCLDRLQNPEAFWGWLSAMTANICHSTLRKLGREVSVPQDEEGNSLLDSYETIDQQAIPEASLDQDETRQMIAQLVDELPQLQRECVLLFYYQEMSVKEIAAALDTPEGTIKSRLNYARRAIKEGVERFAAQGVKLYGLSPLPFLVYFLQKDALQSSLSSTQAEILSRAVLTGSAATAGGAAAAGSAGAAGAGASVSAGGTGGQLLAGILAHKGIAAAAAVLLCGGIASGVALSQQAPPPSPTPVVEVAAPLPSATPLPSPSVPPAPTPSPTPVPTPTPAPTPSASPTPSPSPSPSPSPTPSPTATPTPSPSPSPTPRPTPTPMSTPVVELSMSQYTGGYGDSHAFPIRSISGAKTSYSQIQYSSTNPAVADVTEIGGMALLSPGQAEIIATFPADNNFQVRLPVTVENHLSWSHQWEYDSLLLAVGERKSNYVSAYGLPQDSSLLSVDWSSSNPGIASVESDSGNGNFCWVTGISSGTATVTGVYHFSIWTNVGTYPMSDTISFPVVVQ